MNAARTAGAVFASPALTFRLLDSLDKRAAALLLTVDKYQSPNGQKIQDEAVMPTVLVGQTAGEEEEETAALPAKTDQPLQKAIELLKAKNG
jgi:C-terminal processing protease CtpA/Prc